MRINKQRKILCTKRKAENVRFVKIVAKKKTKKSVVGHHADANAMKIIRLLLSLRPVIYCRRHYRLIVYVLYAILSTRSVFID